MTYELVIGDRAYGDTPDQVAAMKKTHAGH